MSRADFIRFLGVGCSCLLLSPVVHSRESSRDSRTAGDKILERLSIRSERSRIQASEGDRNLHGYYGYYGYGYRYPRYFGYGYRPYTVCYYSYYYGGGYVCYLLSATASAFSRMLADERPEEKTLVYERAVDDAVRYLRDGGELSQDLHAAVELERELIRESGLRGGSELSERTLVEMVLGRTDELKGAVDWSMQLDNGASDRD